MTNNEFFVDEVNTDVREENFKKQLKKYGWVIFAIIAGVLAFVAIYEILKNREVSEGHEQYQTISAAQTGENVSTDDLLGFESELSALEAAHLKVEAGDDAGAIAIYQSLVDNTQYSETARELARLHILNLEGGAETTALANPGAAFFTPAKMIEADNLIKQGKTDEALVVLNAILANTKVQSERVVVETVMTALGGEVEDLAPSDVEVETTASDNEISVEDDQSEGQ